MSELRRYYVLTHADCSLTEEWRIEIPEKACEIADMADWPAWDFGW